jgi:hypothetical protein
VTAEQGRFTSGNAHVSIGAYNEVYWQSDETWHCHSDEAYTEREMTLTR